MAGGHRCSLRHNVCRPATKAYTRIYNYVNIYTPSVAATSFFTGEAEIFDFVTERVKRCIAAKRENVWGIFWEHTMMGEFKIWFEILVIYFISTALLIKIHIPCTKKWAAQCYSPNPCFLIWQNQKHDGRSYAKTSDDISTAGEMSRWRQLRTRRYVLGNTHWWVESYAVKVILEEKIVSLE